VTAHPPLQAPCRQNPHALPAAAWPHATLGLLACGLLLGWGPARAGITPLGVHTSASTTGDTRSDPRATVWQYDLALLSGAGVVRTALQAQQPGTGLGSVTGADHLLLPGGSFTLLGFAGYVDQSCLSPEGWTCVASQLGLSAAEALADTAQDTVQALGDIFDLTWTYVGVKLAGTVEGLSLGSFSAESTATGSGTLAWSSQVGRADAARARSWLQGGDIAGPGALTFTVPEPSTLALAALALATLAGGLGLAPTPRRRIQQAEDGGTPPAH
jgi:hypothetical protein